MMLQRDQHDTTVTKYLAHYAQPEAGLLDNVVGDFHQGLVVPVYRETYAVLERFKRFACANEQTLLIVVVNRPDNDHDNHWCRRFFSGSDNAYWQSDNQALTMFMLEAGSAVLLVDRCFKGAPLPEKQGVGLARKIGADILCTLIHRKIVRSPWLFNTDADAYLPVDYFAAASHANNSTAAIIYPFTHCFTDNITQAGKSLLPALLYEFSLHYYVQGLLQAGSAYAYHTLGSTIAVHYQYYAVVRGFPRRAGAEDFYLLNKLAKTGDIVSLQEPLIQLSARESNRVPFGTGPAVINLKAQANPLLMPLYHPESFCYLRLFLQLFGQLTDKHNSMSIQAHVHSAVNQYRPEKLDAGVLLSVIEQMDLVAALDHCYRHGKAQSTRMRHLHHWFDGFKTLKFIHYLREHFLGTITFQQWLKDNPRPTNSQLTASIKRINQCLHAGYCTVPVSASECI